MTLCVDGVIPDNFNVCAPNLPPPAAVLSLDWDTAADLDLQVTTPDGKLVDAKHPTTARHGRGRRRESRPAGVLDVDAQAGCRTVGAAAREPDLAEAARAGQLPDPREPVRRVRRREARTSR